MAYRFLLTIFFVLFSDVHSENNSKCSNMEYAPNYQESQCVATKTFYLYASSKPCENCCIKRTLSNSSPNVVDIVEGVKNGTSAKTAKFSVTQMKPKPMYDIGGGYFYNILAGTDCVNSAVIYNTKDDQLFVFSHDKKPGVDFLKSLKGVTKCDMKMYPYNPDVNCQGM